MATRRKFTLEFRIEAAHRVIDSGRSVTEVAREIAVSETVLFRWVRDERRRMEALAGTSDEPLSASERAACVRVRSGAAGSKWWRSSNTSSVKSGTISRARAASRP